MTTTEHTPLIDTAATGIEVSWSFGNGDADAVRLPRAQVRQLFEQHGFALHAPDAAIDEDEALRRVRRQGTGVQHLSVRELARPHKDTPRCVGVYVRRADATQATSEAGDGWEMVARVRVQAGACVALPPEGVGPADMAVRARTDKHVQAGIDEAKRLAGIAQALLDECHNADLSSALVAAAKHLGCVSRRPGGGGVYLLFAGDGAERYLQLLRALSDLTAHDKRSHRFSHQAQEVYAKPLTVASWRDSTEAQLTGELGRLLGDLEQLVQRGVMREKTMHARSMEADAACKLAEQARAFLGSTTDALKQQLQRVGAAFAKAATEDLTAAKAVLDSLPDVTRTSKHAKAVTTAQPELVPAPAAEPAATAAATPHAGKRKPVSFDELFPELT